MSEILRLLRAREFAAAGYLMGWKVVGLLPRPLVARVFRWAADKASDDGRGMEQLRRNLTRVVGAENVTRALVRDALRSYARYWMEAFRLPRIAADPDLHRRLTAGVSGRETFERSLARGRGVILVLPHTGNWDMAGMWLVKNYTSFATVAERVKPEALYQAFVDYREELGFEVLAHSGDRPPFSRLKEVLIDGGVVCLLGERDLKQSGIEVEFFGETATFPAGTAQLAIETGANIHVVHAWFTDDGWGLKANEPVEVTTVAETTQRIADEFAENIRAHPTDWHMLQPLWVADVPKKAKKAD
ncbi:phosphatidylinositol mannoside acyltransferase [Corynebacterium yudongzhengii]|uniref:Phosphatidylinositol mannoside acyltransferase n=1 Tax=Corynebacterium yudongzhengii TaxID=2080740 RepID=A0A2U1T4X3_9CORY|nr:phosphatidylinositol mannoside acyltransferase [Corynebacterium yudongzhengii]AWB81792.1 phosphatidylinositol mannoside acyltransferase [Corynebacterium yudongzhengii]PWC01057.1 phosphatidylinositol mannoside acyltransferase [Corynebacterium yudongzhengii]